MSVKQSIDVFSYVDILLQPFLHCSLVLGKEVEHVRGFVLQFCALVRESGKRVQSLVSTQTLQSQLVQVTMATASTGNEQFQNRASMTTKLQGITSDLAKWSAEQERAFGEVWKKHLCFKARRLFSVQLLHAWWLPFDLWFSLLPCNVTDSAWCGWHGTLHSRLSSEVSTKQRIGRKVARPPRLSGRWEMVSHHTELWLQSPWADCEWHSLNFWIFKSWLASLNMQIWWLLNSK